MKLTRKLKPFRKKSRKVKKMEKKIEKRRTRGKKTRKMRKGGRMIGGETSVKITKEQEDKIIGLIDLLQTNSKTIKSDIPNITNITENNNKSDRLVESIHNLIIDYQKSKSNIETDITEITEYITEYIDKSDKLVKIIHEFFKPIPPPPATEDEKPTEEPTPPPAAEEEKPTEEPTPPPAAEEEKPTEITVKNKIDTEFEKPIHFPDYIDNSEMTNETLMRIWDDKEKDIYKILNNLKIFYVRWFKYVKKNNTKDDTQYTEPDMYVLRELLNSLKNLTYEIFSAEDFMKNDDNKKTQLHLFNKLKGTIYPSKINLFYDYIKDKNIQDPFITELLNLENSPGFSEELKSRVKNGEYVSLINPPVFDLKNNMEQKIKEYSKSRLKQNGE